jgi:hypothetical protein
MHWRIKPAQPRPLARLGYQRKSVQSVNEILEVYYYRLDFRQNSVTEL